ncbi:MAG: PA14 domain-containing protein [Ginsengibacter sp.]
MKRIFYILLLTLFSISFLKVSAQPGVLDPNDADRIFSTTNQPPAPSYGVISKWGHTNRLNWNPYSYGFKSYYFKGMAFRLKFPKSYQHNIADGKVYPMLVFLHGLGEYAPIYDNELQLLHGGQLHAQAVTNGTYDGFLLYPQSNSGYLQAYFGSMLGLIDSMAKYVKLDIDRITLSGLSSGGQADWDFLQSNSDRWASVMPISAAREDDIPYIQSYITVPIWMSNGGLDNNPSPGTATDVYNIYKSLGGNVTQSFYPTGGHAVWNNFWAEPGYFPALNTAHKANPLVYFQHNQFCPGQNVSAKLQVQPGFSAYEWDKDGVTIPGANTNTLNVTSYGTYRARFKRRSTSNWSAWSPAPVVVSQKQPTVTPPIKVNGIFSNVLPAPDGSTTVPLTVPNIYTSYDWRRISDNGLVSTTNNYVAPVGQYKVQVTEQFGCSSSYSAPFSVIAAAGINVPDKATSLSANTISNNSVQLNWNNNPTPINNETAFEIYRSTIPGNNYKLIAIKGADILSHLDQALSPNTKYYYIVRAINNNGAAPLSNEASASTTADVTPPTAPASLTISGTSRHSVSLFWNTSSDDVGVTAYDIYVNGKKSYSTSQLSFTVFNLDSAVTYAFYVRSRDLSGNISTPSNQVSAVTKNVGLTYKYYHGNWNVLPDFSKLTPIKIGSTPNVDISPRTQDIYYGFVWEGIIKIPVTGTYIFETNSDDGSKLYLSTYSPNATPLVSNDGIHGGLYASGTQTLTAGTYPISITFFQKAGSQSIKVYWTCAAAGFPSRTLIPNSYFGDSVASQGTAPSIPTNLSANAGSSYNKIGLKWTDNSNNETGFEVYRKAPTDLAYLIIATTTSNAVAYTDSALLPSTKYSYKILSINTYGQSALTATVTATTKVAPAPPIVPSGLTANTLSSTKINLTWNDNSNNETSFEIWRSIGANTNYILLNTLSANSSAQITYVDTGLYANVNYYYHVRAKGIGGYTPYSNEVSAITSNNAPSLSPIANVMMRHSSSIAVSILAIDPDGDPINFTINNLPPFGSFTNTGYGKGTITFNPAVTQQGTYTIQVVATDNHSGSTNISFTLTVNNNYPPTIAPINNITVIEGSTNNTNLTANDLDGNNGLVWSLSGAPSFITLSGANGNGVLSSTPNYTNAGSYPVTISVRDVAGATVSTICTVIVSDANPPSEKIYVNILSNGQTPPSVPWNNVTGVLSNNFLNSNNQNTTVGLQFLTSVWNTYNAGSVTGNNSGIYPDNVIRDYYYFGIYGAPNTVDFNVTGLSTTANYNITLFGSSVFSNAGDNGSTVYTLNGVSKILNVQGNQQSTVTFSSISPNASGNILVSMSKAPGAPSGYLNALVIEKPFDDGTIPVQPANLSAQVLSNGSVLLRWKDIAYNESSYLVYRSSSVIGPFILLNAGASNANDSSYLDNTVTGRTTYYYRIEAVNSHGVSGKTNAVAVTTVNKAPVLNSLNSVFVKTSYTAAVNINATDDAGEVLTVTVTNMPSFATYQSNGNGIGTINFAPGVNDIGIYKNITVLVSDNYGGSVTRSFDLNVTDSTFRSIYVNFSSESGISVSAPWNNYLYFPFANLALSNLLDEAGVNTGYNVKFLQQLTGNFNSGMTANNKGIYPDSVLLTSVYYSSTSPAQMEFTGLNPGKKYNVVIVSSSNSGDDASATFSSGGKSVSLNGMYNATKTVQLNDLIPNASGIIDVTFTKSASALNVNINAVILQEYSGAPLIRPADLFTETVLQRDKINLTWSDRSNNETGFEIWRSTSFAGPYTLIATTTPNLTTFSNSGLTPNTKYYYKVRAKMNSTFSAFSNISAITLPSQIVLLNWDINYHAPSPWNSTDAPPVAGGTFSNLQDNAFNNTGYEMLIVQPFNGEFYAGVNTGGIFPNNVMQSNYWTDASQTSQVKLLNLDQRKKYRIGCFGSATWYGFFNGTYTINGTTLKLNSHNNNSKVVYFEDVMPNEDGEIVIDISPEAGSPYCFTAAITIEAYDASGSQTLPFAGKAAPVPGEREYQVPASEKDTVFISSVKAYPNPFIDNLKVDLALSSRVNHVALAVYDVNSRIVYQKILGSGEITRQHQILDLAMTKALPPGIYFLKVICDGIAQQTIKLVKSR